ncbi:MAG: c-type cytochrome [Hyphomicrobiaceae bacterium]
MTKLVPKLVPKTLLLLSTATIAGALLGGVFAGQSTAQDLQNGANSFRKCRACHDTGPNAVNKVGPPLNGIYGRTAGSYPGFTYSEAMRTAGSKKLAWTDESLNGYLESPSTYLPKNKMAFKGIPNEAERADLIAFLKTLKP